ncbi:MAG: RagB/SusD family nutrient uptake outer membrane protein [Flavobacteriaceae bacterium]|nr:RagB/SusD family nutrient uptake outer membrane protein [Flavobacteriaceae bacterium]
MKKSVIIAFTIIVTMIWGCDKDFLERYPLDSPSPETYFQSENELRTYTNSFYSIVPGDGGLDIWGTYIDDEATFSVSSLIAGTRTVPTTGGGWTWGTLRDINFFLENIDRFPGDDNIRDRYIGLARFFRAWFYFDKVKTFGDVPWYSRTIGNSDEELLTKARDSRTVVMDSILADIDYAVQHLEDVRNSKEITKWSALALKSRIFLFEGTFRKYHGIGDFERMLDESIEASTELMQQSGYGIYTSSPDKAYHELFIAQDAIADELILAREFDLSIPYTHSVNFRTNSSSYGRPGVTKQLVNSYLMADGSRFTDMPNYQTMEFYEECQNRDPRLAQTIRTPGYKQIGEDETAVPDFTASMTGYQYIKYLLSPVHFSSGCDNDLSVFRYAEVLLNYAEAKAEKGTLNQGDLDFSVQLIRDRVGMPNIDMALANANPDPYLEDQYRNVTGSHKGVILEIRRERRIELVRENFRWDDIVRWKEGHNLVRPFLGMYFPGEGAYDLDKDGTIDLVLYDGEEPSDKLPSAQYYKLGEIDLLHGVSGGNIIVNRTVPKEFDENRDYLYPIPTQERILNPNLTQNPGWDDGLGH